MIKYVEKDGKMIPLYFDKNGKRVLEGSIIKRPNGKLERVYLTEDGELGTDATNPKWIETGRAVEGEFGIYPLTDTDLNEIEVLY